MAEEASALELEGLEKHLKSLLNACSSDESRGNSETFCPAFCKLVEDYTCHCRAPMPQLEVLGMALRYFARGSGSFSSNCDHVHYTLSSLALSVFELLLFFDHKDFLQHRLKDFTVTFQECHLALARHQNVHMLQLKELIQDGGPWGSPVWKAVLAECSLPQDEVDDFIGSELPMFLELRVHYLLACQRLGEATALAGRCAWHPTAGQHLFFLQAYLTCLYKSSQHEQLHTEAAKLGGREAVKIICSLENEERNELLLSLTQAFLCQQLHRGDMCHLWDLVFIWSQLHRRVNTSKQALLEECRQLLLSATNVGSVFPFIRVILGEVGAEGLQFCLELCAGALQSDLPCDGPTKSLLYKTIGGLLPSDLEVCRACALLVFFQERTADACKTVLFLYAQPDQEYSAEGGPVGNHVRFDILQVLKKGMHFDPEFWNMVSLRTNCLKLLKEKVPSASLEELMEEKWVPSYCAKEAPPCSNNRPTSCRTEAEVTHQAVTKKRQLNEDGNHIVSKRHKASPAKMQPSANHAVKKKGRQGTRRTKESPCESFRRSFWQFDKPQRRYAQPFGSAEHRRTTRLSEKIPEKRRIRQPRWLLEDSGTLEKNNARPTVKKEKMKRRQKQHQASMVRRQGSSPIKNDAKHKAPVNCHLTAKENGTSHRKTFSADGLRPASPTQVILELSQPDNELIGTFTEDSCTRKRGLPQVLLYKPTASVPVALQPAKALHGKEVVLRARDANAFVLQLHCYARRRRGKGAVSNIPASVSTITRSSVQGGPPKRSLGVLCDKPVVEMKVTIASQTAAEVKVSDSPICSIISQAESTNKVLRATAGSLNSTVDRECVVAANDGRPKTSAVAKVSKLTALDNVASEVPDVPSRGIPIAQNVLVNGHCEENSHTLSITCEQDNIAVGDPQKENAMEMTNVVHLTFPEDSSLVANDEKLHTHPLKAHPADADFISSLSQDPNDVENSFAPAEMSEESLAPKELHSTEDVCALTLMTERVTELASEALLPDAEVSKEDTSPMHKTIPNGPCETLTTSTGPVTEQAGASAVPGCQEDEHIQDMTLQTSEDTDPGDTPQESEESNLEYCCTICKKVFKGKFLVAHAMFHYRNDRCMFCGMLFKDNILAMMHLSEHIERLKKRKEPAQESHRSETEGIGIKKSATPETRCLSPARRRGRPRKFPSTPSDSITSAFRALRSNNKLAEEPVLDRNGKNMSESKMPNHKVNGHVGKRLEKHVDAKQNARVKEAAKPPKHEALDTKQNVRLKDLGKPSQHKNVDTNQKVRLKDVGKPIQDKHVGSKETVRLKEVNKALAELSSSSTKTERLGTCTAAMPVQVEKKARCSTNANPGSKEPPQSMKAAATKEVAVVPGNAAETEIVSCPMEGCSWNTDLIRNRVSLVYHALDHHYGNAEPLELAFRVGNSRCGICMRVMWSFQHYQHHVERHRLAPRHPCLHQGCGARFKTGLEMRRHTRRHSPLQAVCCLPGCSKLFICLWALNLHEREHYASIPPRTPPKTNLTPDEKHHKEQFVKKQPSQGVNREVQGQKSTVPTALRPASPVSRPKHEKPSLALSSQAPGNPPVADNQTAPPTTDPRVLVTQSKVRTTFAALSKFMRNLSNKGDPTHPVSSTKVFKHNLKEGQLAKNKVTHHKRKNVSSFSPSASNSKLRTRLKDKQVQTKVKGDKSSHHVAKSTKLNKTVSHKMLAAAQKATTNFDKADQLKEQDIPTPLGNSHMSNMSKQLPKNEYNAEEVPAQDAVEITTTGSPATLTENPLMPTIVEEPSDSISLPLVLAECSNITASPFDAIVEETRVSAVEDETKGLHVTENCSLPKDEHTQSAPDVKTAKKKCPGKDRPPKDKNMQSAPLKSAKAKQRPKVAHSKVEAKMAKKKHLSKAPLPKDKNRQSASDVMKTLKKKSEGKSSRPKDKNTQTAPADSSKAKKRPKPAKVTADVTTAKKKCLSQSQSIPSTLGNDRKCETSTPSQPVTGDNEVSQSLVSQEVEGKEKISPQNVSTANSGDHTAAMAVQPSEPQRAGDGEEWPQNVHRAYRPYIRPPPTTYLDEQHTTMPKRRKKMNMFHSSPPTHPLPQQTPAPAVAAQRQRCASCFVSFSSAEELQTHLLHKKCSNLFGFDSDDEGNC